MATPILKPLYRKVTLPFSIVYFYMFCGTLQLRCSKTFKDENNRHHVFNSIWVPSAFAVHSSETIAVNEILRSILKMKTQSSLCKLVIFYFISDDLQEAKKLLAKMKYFANLEDKLKNKKMPS